MKSLRVSVALLGAAALVLTFSGTAAAFHSGGVAECSGCHSIHAAPSGGSYLLVGTDQSSTCLSCHESADTAPTGYHISTAESQLGAGKSPVERTPGGDFAWLKKNYTYAGEGGTTVTEYGQGHGHNIVAVDKNYAQDYHNAVAPGGAFPAANLACTSCHDPHGQYRRLADGTVKKTGGITMASGSYYDGKAVANNEPGTYAVGVYRLLAGAGYTKSGVSFPGNPAAKVPSTYNRTEAVTPTRVAYGDATTSGHASWGQWCGTCHPDMHSQKSTNVHPIDAAFGSTTASNYNSYVKTGDMTGMATGSFTSLAPFVEATGDYTALAAHATNNGSQLGGPSSSDKVSCVSCHRAHASGMMYSLRYDTEYEFMTKGGDYVGTDNPEIIANTSRGPLQARGRTIAEWKAAYYDRPAGMFATYQRVLCNKCHAKD